ncbi:ABC-type bacteriocin/lantibiotic exporter, contains an N-terminal double-glycine peptidase domain [Roseomonas rosea]|uniref:ABC-type bacteriocin/lantibiotic exporter, contains an N-terminal double-glycine peptidase domain n=1 Tax=Muricoccus roseus TaxID=198092 RepID=A0A1M6HLS1_9PROT|nr:ABC-type bacteriocin/lantibiotic exporter, contains an N-terminal double-glycine peptidase domain [Roseomonas rosea]
MAGISASAVPPGPAGRDSSPPEPRTTAPGDGSFDLPVHAPLRLDDPGARWIVEAGSVALFVLRAASGPAQEGARRYLGAIPQGGLVCGLGEDLAGNTVIAVGSAGTRMRPLLLSSGPAGPAADEVAVLGAAIDIWARALADGIGRPLQPRPRADVAALPDGRRLRLSAGMVVTAGAGPLWLRLNAGEWLLLGLERLDGLVPLPMGAWLTCGGGVCRPMSAAEAVRASDWEEGLSAFNAALLEALPAVLALEAADALNRRRLREAREAEALSRQGDAFGAVLGNAPARAGISDADPLMPVFGAVAAHLGVEARRPVRVRAIDVDATSTLEELARASGLRLRPVRLEPGWWRADHGPLFVRRGDGAVVGLLPERGGYRLCSPEHPSGARLDPAAAASLSPTAWAPLVPLPRKKLGLSDLLGAGMRHAAGDASAILATLLIGAALGQAVPMATGLAFTLLIPGGHLSELAQLGLALVLVAAVSWAVGLGGEVARQRIEARAGPALHAAIWDRVIRLPLAVLNRQTVGETAARAGAAISLATQIRALGFAAVSSVAVVLSSAVVMLLFQPLAASVGLGLLVLQMAAANLAGWLQGRAYASGEALSGLADAMVLQIISGLVKLRLAGAEARVEAIWAERFAGMRRRLVAARRIGNGYDAFATAYGVLSTAGAFLIIALLQRVEPGRAAPSLASVMTFLSAYGLMMGAGTQLAKAVFSLWFLLPTRRFAQPLLDTLPEPETGRVDPGRLSGALALSGITFRYGPSEPWIFQGLDLKVEAGEFVAITGRSGAGKSTLVRLLLGLEEPVAGAIYLDGHDLRGLETGAVRRQVGTVVQAGRLPPGSLRDAVRGTTGTDDAAVWAALERAALAGEVRAMPMGLETMLTDAARVLSGGQAQRLLLARAFLQKPALLILDEATSALDNITQEATMRAIRTMPATRLVIAHRLSTIRHADRIVVLDNGRIVESGRFQDLIGRRNGLFAQQFAEEARWRQP